MPDYTPKLGIPKPLGNETVSREAFNNIFDQIDTAAASQADFDVHVGSGGSAHSSVIAGGAAGFMTGADKSKLDGATSAATSSAIMQRDSNGRAQVAGPAVANDVANKGYVDDIRADSAKSLVIEVRTSDPVSPAVGRMWVRSDL